MFNQGHKWSPKPLLLPVMWIITKCLCRRKGDKHMNYTKEHVTGGSQVYSGRFADSRETLMLNNEIQLAIIVYS